MHSHKNTLCKHRQWIVARKDNDKCFMKDGKHLLLRKNFYCDWIERKVLTKALNIFAKIYIEDSSLIQQFSTIIVQNMPSKLSKLKSFLLLIIVKCQIITMTINHYLSKDPYCIQHYMKNSKDSYRTYSNAYSSLEYISNLCHTININGSHFPPFIVGNHITNFYFSSMCVYLCFWTFWIAYHTSFALTLVDY